MIAEIGSDMDKAAGWLISGNLVAIPTETVYGLAANALDPIAVVKIFEAKNRPFFDPLIVHISQKEDPEKFVKHIPEVAKKLIVAFWPGALTLILPKKDIIPDIVSAGLDTIGIRMPSHPVTNALLEKLPFPLAAPSANPFGYISPTTAQHVYDQLSERIPYILEGGHSSVGIESTIIGFEEGEPVIYRLGGISVEEITKITGSIRLALNQSSNPTAPGQLKSHYAPLKPLIIGDIYTLLHQYPSKKAAVLGFKETYSHPGISKQWVLSAKGNLNDAAIHLFSALREADQSDSEIIYAEIFPDSGLGKAINDRLHRAASR